MTFYVITETRQTGGTPHIYDTTLYDHRADAIEDATELQRRARENGRQEVYDVYELTHDHDAAYDFDRDAAVSS